MTLLLDSGVLADQQLNERTQQRFASLADVVNKLEKTQVQREFLLGDAPMRTQPTAQERPKAFPRVDMHVTQADTREAGVGQRRQLVETDEARWARSQRTAPVDPCSRN